MNTRTEQQLVGKWERLPDHVKHMLAKYTRHPTSWKAYFAAGYLDALRVTEAISTEDCEYWVEQVRSPDVWEAIYRMARRYEEKRNAKEHP